MNKLENGYSYAVKNGYRQMFEAYVSLQYSAYCDNCKRCDIDPMSFDSWMKNHE